MKRLFTTLLILGTLAFPLSAFGAITRDSSSAVSENTCPRSWTHTVSGSNTYLAIFVIDDTKDGITSVTYNGVAMTQLAKQLLSGTTIWEYWYGLANPSSGSNTVTISCGTDTAFGIGVSYDGAQQTTTPDATTTSTSGSSASPYSTNITTVASGAWIISASRSSLQINGSTNATYIRNRDGTSQPSDNGIYDSNGAVTPGVNTVSWTFTGTVAPIGNVIFSLAPYVAPTPSFNFWQFQDFI